MNDASKLQMGRLTSAASDVWLISSSKVSAPETISQMNPRFNRLTASALALVLAACGEQAPPPAKDRKAAAVPVTVAKVTNVAWDRTVSIVGTLFPKDEATLAAEVEGFVEKTFVDFGERVTNEQPLALIAGATYEAQLQERQGNLARAQANLSNAKQNLDRSMRLANTGAVSASDLDAAKSMVAQWDAEVIAAKGSESVAKLNLQHSHVIAPFDGAISQRIVGRGDFVKIGSPLFAVVNDKTLKFIFQVPERFASQVKKELDVTFSVDNYPGEEFKGRVFLISPVVSMATRSFNVVALVANNDLRLKASTFARGSLVVERGVMTPVVPLDAVVSFAGLTKVFVVQDGKARNRTVKVGRIQAGKQEIMDGLKEGEVIVITGQGKLTEGAAVLVPPPAEAGKTADNNQPAAR